MIKQKRSKIKQATLPFVLESTHEVIPARRQAGFPDQVFTFLF